MRMYLLYTIQYSTATAECYVTSRTGLLMLIMTGLVQWDKTHHAFTTENIAECYRQMDKTDTSYLTV